MYELAAWNGAIERNDVDERGRRPVQRERTLGDTGGHQQGTYESRSSAGEHWGGTGGSSVNLRVMNEDKKYWNQKSATVHIIGADDQPG